MSLKYRPNAIKMEIGLNINNCLCFSKSENRLSKDISNENMKQETKCVETCNNTKESSTSFFLMFVLVQLFR